MMSHCQLRRLLWPCMSLLLVVSLGCGDKKEAAPASEGSDPAAAASANSAGDPATPGSGATGSETVGGADLVGEESTDPVLADDAVVENDPGGGVFEPGAFTVNRRTATANTAGASVTMVFLANGAVEKHGAGPLDYVADDRVTWRVAGKEIRVKHPQQGDLDGRFFFEEVFRIEDGNTVVGPVARSDPGREREVVPASRQAAYRRRPAPGSKEIVSAQSETNTNPRKVVDQTAAVAPAMNATIGFEVGNQAPEIMGEDIDGKKFKLSDYRGKVVLLDFWGDW